jgi:hypothetical protein
VLPAPCAIRVARTKRPRAGPACLWSKRATSRERVSVPEGACRSSAKGRQPRTPKQSELLLAAAAALRSPLRRIALDVLFPWRREREPRDPGKLISEEVGWESLAPAVL